MRAATYRGRYEPYAGRIGEKPDAEVRHPTPARTRRTERASYPVDRRCGPLVGVGSDSRLAAYLVFQRDAPPAGREGDRRWRGECQWRGGPGGGGAGAGPGGGGGGGGRGG